MTDALADYADMVSLGPQVWPTGQLQRQPGDLSQFLPSGDGWYYPLVQEPVDSSTPESSSSKSKVSHCDPIRSAPWRYGTGGVLCFSPPQPADFQALMRMLRLHPTRKEFAVFGGVSPEPFRDRYFAQIRIVTRWALTSKFSVPEDSYLDALTQHTITVGEAMSRFIEQQKNYWGEEYYPPKMRRQMGSDGDSSLEALCFGLLIENAEYGVYRLWTRAWLVGK